MICRRDVFMGRFLSIQAYSFYFIQNGAPIHRVGIVCLVLESAPLFQHLLVLVIFSHAENTQTQPQLIFT